MDHPVPKQSVSRQATWDPPKHLDIAIVFSVFGRPTPRRAQCVGKWRPVRAKYEVSVSPDAGSPPVIGAAPYDHGPSTTVALERPW